MKREVVCISAIALCLLSLPAVATLISTPLPAGTLIGSPYISPFILVGGVDTKAYVTSWAYDLGGDTYLYAYQISGATAKFTWFSVAFNPIAINEWHVEYTTETAPIEWVPVDDSTAATSMEAFFSPGLTAANNSALLWFTCTKAPDPSYGAGALAKMSIGGGVYAEGNVLVPLPEPLTAILLGSGWILLRRYKHKEA